MHRQGELLQTRDLIGREDRRAVDRGPSSPCVLVVQPRHEAEATDEPDVAPHATSFQLRLRLMSMMAQGVTPYSAARSMLRSPAARRRRMLRTAYSSSGLCNRLCSRG